MLKGLRHIQSANTVTKNLTSLSSVAPAEQRTVEAMIQKGRIIEEDDFLQEEEK